VGLRNYQQHAINEIEACTEKNILLQMPTGAGKTFTFTEIAKRYFSTEVKKVLILVHRSELLLQAKISLGEKVFCIHDGVTVVPDSFDYYIGMVETVNRRLKKLPNFGLVICDEIHVGNFKKLPFFTDPNVKVLGVTATPIGSEPLSNLFQKIIIPTEIKTLIENNYLLNCDVYGVASDLVGVQKFKSKGGDFDTNQLDEFYSSEKMVANVLKAYREYSLDKKALIFNVNVNHNNTVTTAFKNNGYNVYSLDGTTPSLERALILNKYKNEPNAILCNVGVLTTGFDEPSIQTIFLNRATKSLALYLQMIGRGSRLHETKDKFVVIDLGKNTNRFGFYDSFYDWEKFFRTGKKQSEGNGVSPSKECPQCAFILHTRSLVCTNCGFSFEEEKAKQLAEEKEQKFYLLTQKNPINIPTEKLFEVAKERGWKAYAVLHKIAEHIVNYQNKYKTIVTDIHCESMAIIELAKWCKEFEKKNNQWHKNFIIQLINDKRSKVTTADLSMVSQ
jgi:superfamily II DNA or RNA helicase